MQKFKVGIIGLGVGEKQIPAFEGHPSCEVRAICDFSDKRLSAAAAYCPDAKLTNSAAHILDDPGIDIVSIASFDNYHFEQISTAIRNGKHVFVEKPMCLYFQEALMIQRLLGENPGIQLSSNLNLRTCPRFIRLKHLIKCGEMGQIPYLEGDYLWGRVHKLTNGWRKDMEFYSIIHGAAVHMVDLIMWITEKKPAEVHAYGNQMATANSGLRYNDFAVILMKFENGMIAKVSANGGCVHPHFHKVSVHGTEKTFTHDISGARLFESCDPKANYVEITDEYPGPQEKGQVITSFIDSIVSQEAKPVVSCDDVFSTMSVCFAAERSVQEAKPIVIEYI